MRPILTTGVALVAAAVVVANPVTPPIRDMQISTTQLSTSPPGLIPFDKSLLNSFSQQSAPFGSALAQILGALAAKADRIGNEVNPSGYAANPTPAPAAAATAPTPAPAPAEAVFIEPNGTRPVAPVALSSAPLNADIQQMVIKLVQDTASRGNKVLQAAYAAVDALVNTPVLIFKAVIALLQGNLTTAFNTLTDAIKAFCNPGLILVDGVHDIVGDLTGSSSLSPAAAASGGGATDGTAGPEATPDRTVSPEATSDRTDRTGAAVTGSDAPAAGPRSGGSNGSKATRAAIRAAQTDPVTDSPEPTPTDSTDSTEGTDSLGGSAPTGKSSTDSAHKARPGAAANGSRGNAPRSGSTGGARPSTGTAKAQSSGGGGATAAGGAATRSAGGD